MAPGFKKLIHVTTVSFTYGRLANSRRLDGSIAESPQLCGSCAWFCRVHDRGLPLFACTHRLQLDDSKSWAMRSSFIKPTAFYTTYFFLCCHVTLLSKRPSPRVTANESIIGIPTRQKFKHSVAWLESVASLVAWTLGHLPPRVGDPDTVLRPCKAHPKGHSLGLSHCVGCLPSTTLRLERGYSMFQGTTLGQHTKNTRGDTSHNWDFCKSFRFAGYQAEVLSARQLRVKGRGTTMFLASGTSWWDKRWNNDPPRWYPTLSLYTCMGLKQFSPWIQSEAEMFIAMVAIHLELVKH